VGGLFICFDDWFDLEELAFDFLVLKWDPENRKISLIMSITNWYNTMILKYSEHERKQSLKYRNMCKEGRRGRLYYNLVAQHAIAGETSVKNVSTQLTARCWRDTQHYTLLSATHTLDNITGTESTSAGGHHYRRIYTGTKAAAPTF
jgi:hypothetical protein